MLYVDDGSDGTARALEKKFADLAPEAGVVFISVTAQPTETGHADEFYVRLGIHRSLTESAGRALIQQVLAKEMESGLKVYAAVYRGVSGASRSDPAPARAPEA